MSGTEREIEEIDLERGGEEEESKGGRVFASLEIREQYIAGREMPKRYRQQYLRATSQSRPSEAIKIFCMECQGWDREAAVNCDLLGCVNWPYRPGTSAGARGGPAKAPLVRLVPPPTTRPGHSRYQTRWPS